jgi:hypothetical protein
MTSFLTEEEEEEEEVSEEEEEGSGGRNGALSSVVPCLLEAKRSAPRFPLHQQARVFRCPQSGAQQSLVVQCIFREEVVGKQEMFVFVGCLTIDCFDPKTWVGCMYLAFSCASRCGILATPKTSSGRPRADIGMDHALWLLPRNREI